LFQKTIEIKFDLATFNEQRKLWQESNTKNYQYNLLAVGFNPYDGIMIVENGEFKECIPEIDYFTEGINGYWHYSTIDEIYEWIEKEYTSNNNKIQDKSEPYLEEIYIEYDKTNHIPIKINDIYYIPSGVSITGTFYYEINSFEKY
jgi:hypothetical protein